MHLLYFVRPEIRGLAAYYIYALAIAIPRSECLAGVFWCMRWYVASMPAAKWKNKGDLLRSLLSLISELSQSSITWANTACALDDSVLHATYMWMRWEGLVPWEPQPEQTSSSVCVRQRQRERETLGRLDGHCAPAKKLKRIVGDTLKQKHCAYVYAERFLVTWEGVNIFCMVNQHKHWVSYFSNNPTFPVSLIYNWQLQP